MIEKIAVEGDAKRCFWKMYENWQKLYFLNALFTYSKRLDPICNHILKYFCLFFKKKGKQNLPTLTNDRLINS